MNSTDKESVQYTVTYDPTEKRITQFEDKDRRKHPPQCSHWRDVAAALQGHAHSDQTAQSTSSDDCGSQAIPGKAEVASAPTSSDQQQKKEVDIQPVSGNPFTVCVDANCTVKNIKLEIARVKGYSVGRQSLSCDGEDLDDNQKLANIGKVKIEYLHHSQRTEVRQLYLLMKVFDDGTWH